MIFLCLLSVGSFFYWIFLLYYTGAAGYFHHIWLLLSLFFLLLFFMGWERKKDSGRIPLWLSVPTYTVSVTLLLIITILAGIIFLYRNPTTVKDLDYVVVLGSALNKKGEPGRDLQRRLEFAITYLEDNPSSALILSGGDTEAGTTQAQAMSEYLLARGVAASRFYLEPDSRSTRENIINSRELIEDILEAKRRDRRLGFVSGRVLVAEEKPPRIGVLTSDFHVFRVLQLAGKLGYKNMYALAVSTDEPGFLNMLLRECLALLKEKFMGYI